MADWIRHILSCCDREDEEEQRPALQIGHPADFRREDISFPNLDPATQRFLREKAITDAQKLYAHLQPLRSSPSGHFASPENPADTLLPSYEDFTTPRSIAGARTPTTPASLPGSRGIVDRVKRHSRKVSDALSKPSGYSAVSGGDGGSGEVLGREDGKYEMRALMDVNRSRVVSPMQTPAEGKLSSESYGFMGSGSEVEMDKDRGSGMVKL